MAVSVFTHAFWNFVRYSANRCHKCTETTVISKYLFHPALWAARPFAFSGERDSHVSNACHRISFIMLFLNDVSLTENLRIKIF